MIEGASPELRIVHTGEGFAVVDKPAGMLSVPGKGEGKTDCVAARVAAAFPSSEGPIIVHRLDMDTSGLMVVGLTERTQRELSIQFQRKRVVKSYIALVDGLVTEAEEGAIDVPLRVDIEHRPFQVVDVVSGRAAVTRWRLLGHETDRSRMELRPETGRTHQLRVHMAAAPGVGGLGRCILGDVLYGSGYRGPERREARGRLREAPRLMLHATMLSFFGPGSERRVEFVSPAPF